MMSQAWRQRVLWFVLLASLAFNAGVGATVGVKAYRQYAEKPPEGEFPPPPRMRDLQLTIEQRDELRTERQNLRRRQRALHETIRMETDALADLLTVEQPDRQAIADQLDKLGEYRAQMDQELVEHFLKIRSMLHPAQFEVFDRIVRHALHHGDRRGPGRFGRPHGRFQGRGQEFHGRRHRGPDDPRPPIDEETP